MADFGGLGGAMGQTLDFDENYKGDEIAGGDLFARALYHALGKAMKTDEALCHEVWSALANVDWKHENGDRAGYSFRAAGDLIAAIIGRGDYLDWYCNSPSPQVSVRVGNAMADEGWHFELGGYMTFEDEEP